MWSQICRQMQVDRITLIVPNMGHIETDKTIPVTVTTIIVITIEIMDATTATSSQDTTIDVFTTTTIMDIAVIRSKGATTNDRRLRIAGVIRRIRDIRIIVLRTTARLTHDATIIEQPGVTLRSLSTWNTTMVVALSLHRRARRTSSSFRLSLLVFSLSLCVSVWTRLCRRSAFDSAGTQRLVSPGGLLSLLLSLISSLVSAFLSAAVLCRRSALVSVSFLSHLCLGYASRSSRSSLQVYSTISLVKTTVFSEKLSQ